MKKAAHIPQERGGGPPNDLAREMPATGDERALERQMSGLLRQRQLIDAELRSLCPSFSMRPPSRAKQGLTASGSLPALPRRPQSGKAQRHYYMPPVPPPPSWPVNKPPTLDQMERDMKAWAKIKDQIGALAVHEGRMQEAAVVQPILSEFERWDAERREVNDALRADLDRLALQYEDKCGDLDRATEEVARAERELLEQREHVSGLEAKVHAQTRELAALRAKAAALEEHVRAQSQELTGAEAELSAEHRRAEERLSAVRQHAVRSLVLEVPPQGYYINLCAWALHSLACAAVPRTPQQLVWRPMLLWFESRTPAAGHGN